MRKISFLLFLVGCGGEESLVEESVWADENASSIEEKSNRCRSSRIQCEQMCFREFGQTWGRLSLSYNACMDECLELYEKCTHRAQWVPPREGYCGHATYSWDQPSSDGVNGYYGYCGPTAAANLVANSCGVMVSPRKVAETSFSWTPGTSPRHMVRALNGLGYCGRWARCRPSPRETDVLGTLEKQLPVAALLDWDGALDLHWITVMDIRRTGGSCQVVFNHWGSQDRMECNEFIERWSLTESLVGDASVALRALQPFTYVCRIDD